MDKIGDSAKKNVVGIVNSYFNGKTQRRFGYKELMSLAAGVYLTGSIDVSERIFQLTEKAREEDWPRDELIAEIHFLLRDVWNIFIKLRGSKMQRMELETLADGSIRDFLKNCCKSVK